MTTIIYARSASGSQRQLDGQIDACRNICRHNGWEVDAVITDNGHSLSLPWLEAECRHGRITRIVAWHLDRLTRRTEDWNRLLRMIEEGGVEVMTADGPLDIDRAKTFQRMERTMKRKLRRGSYA